MKYLSTQPTMPIRSAIALIALLGSAQAPCQGVPDPCDTTELHPIFIACIQHMRGTIKNEPVIHVASSPLTAKSSIDTTGSRCTAIVEWPHKWFDPSRTAWMPEDSVATPRLHLGLPLFTSMNECRINYAEVINAWGGSRGWYVLRKKRDRWRVVERRITGVSYI
jgi:hypothetical protein